MALLKIENLNVYYDGIHALHNVCLEVNEGEIVALIGANGAGKSSLLRAISGLVRSTGSIMFDGKDITDLPSHDRARIGIAHVPEGRSIFPDLTVKENLDMGAYAKRAKLGAKDNLEKVLDLFPRLKERIGQQAGTLSGGEQQMLAIARGLLLDPVIMLLDEPSLGLAPILINQVFDTISAIHQSGTSILLVEQNAFYALETAQRGYVMETGLIVISDSTEYLKRDIRVRQSYLGEM